MYKTVVYFIQHRDGHIKIGTSQNPTDRLRSLQTGNPHQLVLLGVIPGDAQTEARLHTKFAKDRVLGEWFQPSVALVAFIEGIQAVGKVASMVEAAAEVVRLKEEVRALKDELTWHTHAELVTGANHREIVCDALQVAIDEHVAARAKTLADADRELATVLTPVQQLARGLLAGLDEIEAKNREQPGA